VPADPALAADAARVVRALTAELRRVQGARDAAVAERDEARRFASDADRARAVAGGFAEAERACLAATRRMLARLRPGHTEPCNRRVVHGDGACACGAPAGDTLAAVVRVAAERDAATARADRLAAALRAAVAADPYRCDLERPPRAPCGWCWRCTATTALAGPGIDTDERSATT
jgi:hypothetical protein